MTPSTPAVCHHRHLHALEGGSTAVRAAPKGMPACYLACCQLPHRERCFTILQAPSDPLELEFVRASSAGRDCWTPPRAAHECLMDEPNVRGLPLQAADEVHIIQPRNRSGPLADDDPVERKLLVRDVDPKRV